MALPILISIPHGGAQTPDELADRSVASAYEIFEDGDAFTPLIYDVGLRVAHVQVARIARAFVDLNRALDDRPPRNPDGVVKSATCFGRVLYREPLDAPLVDQLLGRYYHPYHAALERAARSAGARIGLDCHSMASMPPPVAPDAGEPRPLFCLSNLEGRTCDAECLARLADALASAFECPREQVALNRPFKGGFITRHHGHRPLPWIQLEMNRCWYLRDPWFDPQSRVLDPARARELRERFTDAISLFAREHPSP
jgi:formiminoglutamase